MILSEVERKMKRVCYAASCIAAALLMALSVGCGSSAPATVTGTVTLDGDPVEDALVMFTPLTGGRPAAGRTDAQGKYELVYSRSSDGAGLGEHQVEITTADELEQDDGIEVIPERIPAEYNARSELTRNIEKGANVFDFALESGGEIVDSAAAEEQEGDVDDTGL